MIKANVCPKKSDSRTTRKIEIKSIQSKSPPKRIGMPELRVFEGTGYSKPSAVRRNRIFEAIGKSQIRCEDSKFKMKLADGKSQVRSGDSSKFKTMKLQRGNHKCDVRIFQNSKLFEKVLIEAQINPSLK